MCIHQLLSDGLTIRPLAVYHVFTGTSIAFRLGSGNFHISHKIYMKKLVPSTK